MIKYEEKNGHGVVTDKGEIIKDYGPADANTRLIGEAYAAARTEPTPAPSETPMPEPEDNRPFRNRG